MIKLPPRFRIHYNKDRDYYFLEERFLFFFYRIRGLALGTVLPACRYKSSEEAQAFIKYILHIEDLENNFGESELVDTHE